MSIIGNPIMAGASGPAASIFVTGLSENDTVTATKGSKTLTGKWTQKLNPAIVVPDGYTQLEYIENSDSAYMELPSSLLDSDVQTVQVNAKISLSQVTTERQFLFSCGGWRYSHYVEVGTTGYFGNVNNAVMQCVADTVYDVQMTIDGSTKTTITVNGVGVADTSYQGSEYTPIHIFCVGSNHIGRYVRCHYYELLKNGVVVARLHPVKRNSDGAIGMYDIVSNTFFGNSGTGTFTAGPEVPQTVGGFLISKIKDYGTWTVTATDGTKTAAQDVLVDVITEYEIEMSLSA